MTILQPSCPLQPMTRQARFLHRSLTLAVCLWLGACADPEPPVACGAIPDQTVNVGMKAAVEPCFEDPEMEEMTLSAVSSDPGVASVTVQAESVQVEGVSPGSTTVTVTATDPDMLSAEVGFGVVVPNRPPGIRSRMSPATMLVDGSFRWILSDYFDEPDGQELTYSAESSDPEVVLASVSADTLTATGIAIGVATTTVTAADPSGLTAALSVKVTVQEPDRLLRDDFNTNASLANWGFHADIVDPEVEDGRLRLTSLTPSFVGLLTSRSVHATGWEATTAMGNASDGGWASLVVSTDDTDRFSLYLFQLGADGDYFHLGHTDFRFLVLDLARGAWVINDGWYGTSDAVPEIGEVAEVSMSMKSGTLKVAVGDTELLSIDLQDMGLPVNMIAVNLGVWPREEGAITFFDWVEVTGLSRDWRDCPSGPGRIRSRGTDAWSRTGGSDPARAGKTQLRTLEERKMKATWQMGIVQLGILVVSGCSDKSTVEPDDPITEEEATALFWGASVEQLLEDSTRIIGVRGDTVDASCEFAGTATVVITQTAEVVGGGLRQSSFYETRHSDCEFDWEGFRFVVAEGSYMDHLVGANIAGATFDMFGEVMASLEWSLADRSGTCDVDLVIEGVLDLSDPDNPVGNPWPHYRGTVCGHEVEYDIEYEFVEAFEGNRP